VQAAVAHAQFETIHPFVDGNGRLGRALVHVVFRRRGMTPGFVPPVSLVLATNAGAYIAGLTAFRYDAPPDSPAASEGTIQWVDRFLNELLRACEDAVSFAEQLEELERKWRSTAGNPRRNSAADLLLAALPGLPILTVETAAKAIGRSSERTNDAVNMLRDVGVLEQGSIGRRNRVFEVASLLDAITRLERRLGSPAADTAVAKPTRSVPAPPRRSGRREPTH
jgi:Fic family protein